MTTTLPEIATMPTMPTYAGMRTRLLDRVCTAAACMEKHPTKTESLPNNYIYIYDYIHFTIQCIQHIRERSIRFVNGAFLAGKQFYVIILYLYLLAI